MKYLAFSLALLGSLITCHSHAESTGVDQQAIEDYLKIAKDKKLVENITWKRLLYAEDTTAKDTTAKDTTAKDQKLIHKNQSEVSYSGYFLAQDGQQNIQNELNADIRALFQSAEPNQSVRCKLPARSLWLMQQLTISEQQLPQVSCPEFD